MGTIRWKSQSLKWRLSWCSDLKPTSRLSVFNSCTPQTRKYLYIKLFCLQVGVVSNLFTSPGYRVHFQPSLTSAAAADWLLKWQAVHLSIYLFFIKDLIWNIGSPVFFSLFFFFIVTPKIWLFETLIFREGLVKIAFKLGVCCLQVFDLGPFEGLDWQDELQQNLMPVYLNNKSLAEREGASKNKLQAPFSLIHLWFT